jgi:hypothetical protein
MRLGNGVVRYFLGIFGFGAVSVFGTIIGTAIDGSPYRFDTPGGPWLLIQMGASVMLICAGMFGAMLCNVTEVQAHRVNMSLLWTLFGLAGALFLGGLCFGAWSISGSETPTNGKQAAVVWIGTTTATVAVIAYVQACLYFLRIHRLRKPYREKTEKKLFG